MTMYATDQLSPTASDEKRAEAGDLPEKRNTSIVAETGEIVNASGHRDQLQRQYGLLSVCGLALTVDNAWVAFGTSLQVAIANGGPAGVLYEFLVAAFYYSFIAASIAQLASAIPSAGGVYHWASVTPGPSSGRVVGFFAGSLNFFGWVFDLASIVYIMAELLVQMYAVFHPDYVIGAWNIFVALLLVCWICIAVTIFANSWLPLLQQVGLFMVVVGGFVTIVVVAAMPAAHADASFVFLWDDNNNVTGWPAGVAFLTGVLNGAFTIGTPDSATHMSEELPNPRRDLPKAILAQMGLGTITAFCFGVAIFFGINDLSGVVNSSGSFPLAAVYSQATGSPAATFGLLLIIFMSLTPCLIGTFLTVGRTWWALARDNATPFPTFFSHVNERLSCPVYATLLTGVLTTAFGAITLGSKTGFQDLTGSFVILSSTSYLLAFLPNVINGRKYMPRGPFYMPGALGLVVEGLASLFIIFFNIMFCFPYGIPTSVSAMNWNSVILVGVLTITTFWWFVHGTRRYPGPKLSGLYNDGPVVNMRTA